MVMKLVAMADNLEYLQSLDKLEIFRLFQITPTKDGYVRIPYDGQDEEEVLTILTVHEFERKANLGILDFDILNTYIRFCFL